MMPTVVLGMDVALNHSAFVELTDGKMTNYWYYTTLAGAASRNSHGTRLVFPKTKEKQVKSIFRLVWVKNFVRDIVLANSLPEYVGIEDYAIRAEQGAHYMGEVGGAVRMLCWEKKVKLRLHDPVTVKMFTAHDGTCQKDSVERAVLDRWGVDFSDCNQPSPKPTTKNPKPKPNREVSEDLADAYSIAKIVWTEVLLRRGEITLKDLHKKEIQVFNRITKTYPVSLLDREWISSAQADEDEIVLTRYGDERF